MIAFTVLGGYLGAGKTTLLNHLLNTTRTIPGAGRLALLVNDFGAINIDAGLIESRTDRQINLTNGCICCSLSDGFDAAIAELVDDPQPPDQIVIEASGVADVRLLAQYGRAPGLRLDGVIVVADAETIEARLGDRYVGNTVRRQLAAADLVVLNKTDLLTADAVAGLTSFLADLVPETRVLPCCFGQLPAELLLGIGSTREHPEPDRERHAHYANWSLRRSEGASEEALRAFAAGLPSAVLRAKGTMRAADGQGWLLQAVGARREITRIATAPPGTQLVAIGFAGKLDLAGLDRLATATLD